MAGTFPSSIFPALAVPRAVINSVSVAVGAVAAAVMVSWTEPLTAVIVAGLKVAVRPEERPVTVSVSGAVELVLRVNAMVTFTVNPCLAVMKFGVTDRFTGTITGWSEPLPASVAPATHVVANTTLESSKVWRTRDPRRFAVAIVGVLFEAS